ncbi:hypothetical protein PVAND_001314 [Polypedilum vanderplanki]|uniref:C2H2-type domain-containing protein n=1 Tax=Polypedilum vanderplanki TaxID=319348 RepID=A0A9J6BML4_POLVA|nr:hypothetical protein PVAND_001314 [Polypedilum vanderplanki]
MVFLPKLEEPEDYIDFGIIEIESCVTSSDSDNSDQESIEDEGQFTVIFDRDKAIKEIESLKSELEASKNQIKTLESNLISQKLEYEVKVKNILYRNYEESIKEKEKMAERLKQKDLEIDNLRKQLAGLKFKDNNKRKVCEESEIEILNNEQESADINEVTELIKILSDSKQENKNSEPKLKNNETKVNKKFFMTCRICLDNLQNKIEWIKHMNYQMFNLTKLEKEDNWETRKYRCTLCEFSTNYKIFFDDHLLKHNQINEGAFKCDKCSYSSDDKQELKFHSKVHLENYFELKICLFCEYASCEIVKVKTHMKNKHNFSML